MPQFQAIITTHAPTKRAESCGPDFEVTHSRVIACEAQNEDEARTEFSIQADAEQRARRAKTKLAVTCRFEVLKQAAE